MFQFLPFLNYKHFFLIAGAILCFGGGYFVASAHYKAEIARLNEQGLMAETQALREQLSKEREFQQAAQNATDQAKKELAAVEERYNAALHEFEHADLAGLQHSDGGSAGKAALPSDPGNSSGNCRVQAQQCDCKNSASFKRLSREFLAVARDCEINETYLQQMIRMYQALQR